MLLSLLFVLDYYHFFSLYLLSLLCPVLSFIHLFCTSKPPFILLCYSHYSFSYGYYYLHITHIILMLQYLCTCHNDI